MAQTCAIGWAPPLKTITLARQPPPGHPSGASFGQKQTRKTRGKERLEKSRQSSRPLGLPENRQISAKIPSKYLKKRAIIHIKHTL